VREFYSRLPSPVQVGIEATGSMKWFLNLMEELGIDCQVGHPATIRAAEPALRKDGSVFNCLAASGIFVQPHRSFNFDVEVCDTGRTK
jgi:hypothetical protein